MMNNSIRVIRRPLQARPPQAARAAAAIIVTAGLVLLAACSSSPSSTGASGSSTSDGSTNSQLLAFSQCMRSHGLANFPDPQPSSNGKFPSAQDLGVSQSQYQTAEIACQNLLPVGANDQFPPAEVQQLLVGMRAFSQCMRANGVPNWPDPSVNSDGQPFFDVSAHGITRAQAHSAQLESKMATCQHLLPSALGGTPLG